MLDELRKKEFLTKQNYLNERGKVYYREKVAGKTTSDGIAQLTSYTDVYIRLVIGGFRPVNKKNIVILETIENIALGYVEKYTV